ncbi:MAG: hypothetical protein KGL44_13420 [Sphingomonadales bacterium]|nr:hypothetical protein [Sphingomonadales bacterium]
MATALSLMVLAAVGLLVGAVAMARRGDAASRKKAALMVLLAGIMAINVAIWTLPDGQGQALINRPAVK